MKVRLFALTAASALALAAAPSYAAGDNASNDNSQTAASQDSQSTNADENMGSKENADVSSDDQQVDNAYNGEWLTLTGKVKSVSDEDFTLDYGENTITVEMDDFGNLDENPVVKGDHVTVSGLIDDDFLETRKIEGSSLYVDKLSTYFYADPADEEDAYYAYLGAMSADEGDWVALTGEVTAMSDGSIKLESGGITFDIDTEDLPFDVGGKDSPYDLASGDRVSVSGRVDDADLFDSREINAQSLVLLSG